MTGAKGSAAAIDAKCQTLMNALAPMFATVFEKATGVEVEARPGDIRQGRRRELLAALKADTVYCEASIRLVKRNSKPVRDQTDHRSG